MNFSLEGKKVFISGGGQGIGYFVAKRFIEAGAKVVIGDITEKSADVAKEIGAHFIKVDVSKEKEIIACFEKSTEFLGGKLDIVVNNAGCTDVGFTIEETSYDMLKKMTEVNNYGVFYALKHAPANMNDNGSIINVASVAAVTGVPTFSLYSASKTAVISYTKHSAMELAHRGIRVNAVLPGSLGCGAGYNEDAEKFVAFSAHLGRAGKASEIVGAFHFLAADESAYCTGIEFVVDAGETIGRTFLADEVLAANLPDEPSYGREYYLG